MNPLRTIAAVIAGYVLYAAGSTALVGPVMETKGWPMMVLALTALAVLGVLGVLEAS